MSKSYLQTFFKEKSIQPCAWTIVDKTGTENYIGNEVVIEAILNANKNEQKGITETLRKLDFYNKDINHYLKHLATGLVMNRAGA